MNKESKWNLILVNKEHPLPKDFQVELVTLENGEAVDKRIYSALMKLLVDAKEAGVFMYVSWGHRSYCVQELLVDVNIKNRIERGMTEEDATAHVKKLVAAPGESEHQLGLAVDFQADTSRSSSAEIYEWLAENAHKYGFILRYPQPKVEITGYNYEPWHFRYVGIDHATLIYENEICLEEYLEQILA